MRQILVLALICSLAATATLEAATRRDRRSRRRSRQTPARTYSNRSYNYNYRPATTRNVAPSTIATADATAVSAPTNTEAATASSSTASESDRDQPMLLAMADTLPDVDSLAAVPDGSEEAVPSPADTVAAEVSEVKASPKPIESSPVVTARPHNSALAELNGIRAARGLHALIEDTSLSAIAHRKAWL